MKKIKCAIKSALNNPSLQYSIAMVITVFEKLFVYAT